MRNIKNCQEISRNVKTCQEISRNIAELVASEVVGTLQDVSVPCEIVSTLLEAAENDAFRRMGLFETIAHSKSGIFHYPVPSWDFEDEYRRPQKPAPTLGEHSNEIFVGLTGRSESEINRFERLGLTGKDPLI